MSIFCRTCGAGTRVVDSRMCKNGTYRRRRACLQNSKHRHSTREIEVEEYNKMVEAFQSLQSFLVRMNSYFGRKWDD